MWYNKRIDPQNNGLGLNYKSSFQTALRHVCKSLVEIRSKSLFIKVIKLTCIHVFFILFFVVVFSLVTAKLISAFVFARRIVHSLFFLNPKF